MARKTIQAKKVESKQEGKGNRTRKAAGLTDEEEEKLKEFGVLGPDTPFGLQFTIW